MSGVKNYKYSILERKNKKNQNSKKWRKICGSELPFMHITNLIYI